LVETIAAVDLSVADQRVVSAVLGDVRRVRGWLDSIEVSAARRLTELAAESPSMFPERVVSEAGRVTLTEASKGSNAPRPRQRSRNSVPHWAAVTPRVVMSMWSPASCAR
jgi:hypothetical protein